MAPTSFMLVMVIIGNDYNLCKYTEFLLITKLSSNYRHIAMYNNTSMLHTYVYKFIR